MTDTQFDRDFGAKIQRNVMPTTGARFYRDAAGAVIFTFVIDSGNIIGPRPANKADSEKHPAAWHAFTSGEETPATVDVVPDAREPDERPALSAVEEKDMSGFAALVEPAPPIALESGEPQWQTYSGYQPLSIVGEEAMARPLSPEPASAPAPKPKRKYTRKAA